MGVSTRSAEKNRATATLSFIDKVTLVWFLIDAFTHLTIELGYVYLALNSTASKTDNFLGFIWREYGRADARWAVRDPTVISIEIATVFVGLLCVVNIFAILQKNSNRHVLQIIICTAELYGGWMTFAPEWLEGSPNLDGSSFTLFWVCFCFSYAVCALFEFSENLTNACPDLPCLHEWALDCASCHSLVGQRLPHHRGTWRGCCF